MMRKLIVLSFISLDGVMQAPGGKGEDPSGGFDLEGWTFPYFDEALGKEMDRQMAPPFDLLLGRKTYDIFAAYWPQQGAQDPFGQAVKYVVTSRPVRPDWRETVAIVPGTGGSLEEQVARLKQGEGPQLQVHGSGQLIQALLRHDLVDELWLKIFPVTLGKGKRLFGEGASPAAFRLEQSSVTPSGVIVAAYERAGEVRTGSF